MCNCNIQNQAIVNGMSAVLSLTACSYQRVMMSKRRTSAHCLCGASSAAWALSIPKAGANAAGSSDCCCSRLSVSALPETSAAAQSRSPVLDDWRQQIHPSLVPGTLASVCRGVCHIHIWAAATATDCHGALGWRSQRVRIAVDDCHSFISCKPTPKIRIMITSRV